MLSKLIGLLGVLTSPGDRRPLVKEAQVTSAFGVLAAVAASFGIDISNTMLEWGVRGVMFAVALSPFITAFRGEKHVTPTADPLDDDENPLVPVPADHVVVHRDVAARGLAAAGDVAGTVADVTTDATSVLGHVVGGLGDVVDDLFKHGEH